MFRVLSWSLFLTLFALTTTTPLAFAWSDPVAGTPHPSRVTRSADIPEKNWLPGHRGVDLAAEVNAEILAAGDGTVAFAGYVAGTPVISIDHPEGIRTTYEPVRAAVTQGEDVREGQVIGHLARDSQRKHDGLHWGALIAKDTYINPLTLLDIPVIRLKPVDAL